MDYLMCPRVEMRMECPECEYPLSEARYPLDERLPHFTTYCEDVIQEALFGYDEGAVK